MRYITEIPEEGEEETTYIAVIDFTPDEDIFFGMSVVVNKADQAAAAAQD